ncbi:MAG: ABC transporter ATP-binding protein [Desulfocapsa sp.]|nr:ABC transporter ATP-binding protein [Desulfocapsa sp.]
MDDQNIISVQNVTKTYKLYEKPSDRVKEAFHPARKRYHTPFNAVNNISLTVKRGDTVGIIGRNGSGKSTLLQIICGILNPNQGKVVVDGRISALLELGAGFNPEFSGRENVYLNASILGLKKKEIDACFDKIVAFADIGNFIEQPVKSYSSGMYVRLAFAVAINVNPDILIVDEALSVGDTLFQSKCYAKFREFQKDGVTILFVTHALDLITRYCNHAYLLEKGSIRASGPAKDVVDEYNRIVVNHSNRALSSGKFPSSSQDDNTFPQKDRAELQWEGLFQVNPKENRYGDRQAEILEAGIFSISGKPVQSLLKGEEYEFKVKVRFNSAVSDPIFSYTVKDVKGFDISGTNTLFEEVKTGDFLENDMLLITFRHTMLLNSGGYLLSFGCAGHVGSEYIVHDRRYDYMTFEVNSLKPSVGFLDMESKISISKI